MSKAAPDIYAAPSLGGFYSGQRVDGQDWRTLFEALHTTWRYRGARAGGKLFDPPFETTSTSYVQANESGAVEDLTVWQGSSRLLRNGASNLQVALMVFGANVTVRLTATALDTNTALGSVEISLGAAEEWDEDTFPVSFANANEGSSTANPRRHIGYKIEAKVSSGTGFLYGFGVHEAVLSAASLP
jgi:hypothetical protein